MLRLASGQCLPGRRPVISRCAERALTLTQGAARTAKDLHLERAQCATLLAAKDYHLLQVEAPNVPREELKSAIRWRLKDMIDYHVDDATIDVLDIPPEPGSASGRAHWMYAVAARNEAIQACMREFEEARIPLSIIDIPETAQRNIAQLYETEGRGLALLYMGEEQGILTINYRGELYLARRLEMELGHVGALPGAARDEVYNRIVLELQRTFDRFERQYGFITVTQLLLAPQPAESALAEHLRANLAIPVGAIDLADKLDFAEPLGAEAQWRMFHHLGAALRQDGKAL